MFNETRFCKCGKKLLEDETMCVRCTRLKNLKIARIILGLGIVGLCVIFVTMFI